MRFSAAYAEALKQAGENLFNKSLQGSTFQEQENWLKGAEFIRTRRRAMIESFGKHFDQRFAQAQRRQSALLSQRILDFDASQLKIEQHDVLEAGLNPGKIIDAIRNGAWSSLHELTEWFRAELGDRELSPNDMPLGPKLIGGVASQAIEDQFGLPAVKEFVLSALCRTFPELVNRVYRDLATHLATLPPTGAAAPAASQPGQFEASKAGATSEFSDAAAFSAGDEAEAVAASRAASEVLDPWLSGKRLPAFIAEFLGGPWRAVLATIHQQHGAFSPAWDEALSTLNALMDSLRIKPTAEQRSQLMKSLPDLVRRLGKGLDHIHEAEAARRPFFARLAEYHLKLLQKSQTLSAPTPPLADGPKVAPVADAAAPTYSLTALQTGTWLEVRTPQGAIQKLKLAWISPQRNLFLLTNTLGERVLSLGADNFAALLREGHARVLQAEPGKPGAIIGGKPQFRKIG